MKLTKSRLKPPLKKPQFNFNGTFDGSEHLIISDKSIFNASDSKLTSLFKISLPNDTSAAGAISFNNNLYAAPGSTLSISNFNSANKL